MAAQELYPVPELPKIFIERTLAIIKPDAIHKYEEIKDIILRTGFSILSTRRVQLTPEQASDFYAEHYGKLFFPSLVAYISSGPIIALALAREKAIAHWRDLIGPTNTLKARQTHPDCLRAIYGTDDQRNALHGSDSFSSAEREIRFFFPDSIIEPVPTGQAAKDYLSHEINPTLLKGLTALCKQKPEDPVVWLADWLIDNNPNKPKIADVNVTYTDEVDLIKHLLDRYDNRARPVLNSSHTVQVLFGITPIQISDLDEVNQIFTINVWLSQIWTDERLTWDPRQYNNLNKLRIPQNEIWLPDIVLYNSAEDYKEAVETKITVSSSGEVFWGPPSRYHASCHIDVRYFPFDVQKCILKFGSWIYDGTQVNLSALSPETDMTNYLSNGEWDLSAVIVNRSGFVYDCCTEPYPLVTYTFIVRRRVLYYMFNIVFPCLWLSILSTLTFWLPPDSGEKITLGITVLLAFSVFMLLVAENMPKTSESIPLIGIYLFVTMSLNSIATIQTIVVLKMHHSGPLVQKIPPRLKAFMFNYLSKYLCADDVIASFAKHEASIERYDLDIVTTQIPVINTDIASCLCLVDEKGDNYTTLKQLRKESVQENCPKQRGCTNTL
ncbi:hypothetical protein EB796_006608 [Bugula neritina]|uniref:Nucleoside diphosphate kinase homolog 5 n=1 Tax=Bugula neritina TaxID=10212 RepID=A0A7J7KA41_BUGNE|nr:hypothetical protein EB796_006608 [Bugula neritina]